MIHQPRANSLWDEQEKCLIVANEEMICMSDERRSMALTLRRYMYIKTGCTHVMQLKLKARAR
jgi:hypothetical protein